MARRTLLCFLLGFVTGCAPGAPPRQPEFITPLAWEAVEPETGSALFLLGSIHVGTRDMGRLHPAITSAYARSAELVVEVDLDAGRDQLAAIYARRAYLPDGDRLPDVLAPETTADLLAHLEGRGLDPEPFFALKPWAAMLRLAGMQFERQGYRSEYGVDRSFISSAGDRPIVALESYDLQLQMYDGFTYEVQEMMLRDFLAPEDPYQTRALIDAWRAGDEQTFLDLLFPTAERWRDYRERFFFERNENMASRLSELGRDGQSRFVVVGVGHMVGPRGIPALLVKKHGFRVRRLPAVGVAAN